MIHALVGLLCDLTALGVMFLLCVLALARPGARPVAQQVAQVVSAPLAGQSRVVMSNAPRPGLPGQARKVRVR